MTKVLTAPQRIVVAADFTPPPGEGRNWVRNQVRTLANALAETGVVLKVNSALRGNGYDLIDEIHEYDLQVFADLKLDDISATLGIDGILLAEAKPEIVTVKCSAGVASMTVLKAQLPESEILGITVLTSLSEEEVKMTYDVRIETMVGQFAELGVSAGIDGFVASAIHVPKLRRIIRPDQSINSANIRPAWAMVAGDDQNKDGAMTPADAIKAGVTRLIIGRPITQAKNLRDAVLRTIEEVAAAIG